LRATTAGGIGSTDAIETTVGVLTAGALGLPAGTGNVSIVNTGSLTVRDMGTQGAGNVSLINSGGALTVGVGAAISTALSGSSGATISAPYASSVALTVTSGQTTAGAELTSWDGEILADSATSVTVNAGGALDTGAHISAAKATTAINYFGIETFFDYVIEDNNLKHNKYIPGTKIKIISKEKLKDKIDCLIVSGLFFKSSRCISTAISASHSS
jgi:hypothetical protein